MVIGVLRQNSAIALPPIDMNGIMGEFPGMHQSLKKGCGGYLVMN